jgi:hypothetical protein
MYEKIKKTKFLLKRSSFVHLLPRINYPYHYTIKKFVFFLCIQQFCTCFCHRPIAAAVSRAPAGCSRPPASRAMTPAGHSRPPASRATTPVGCNLPRNAAAAPWPQPPTQRKGCALADPRPRPGVPWRPQPPSGRNLPRNAAAAPSPQPPTQRSGCALAAPRPRPGVPRPLPFPVGRAKPQPHSSHPQN